MIKPQLFKNCGFKLGRNLVLVSLVHGWHKMYKIDDFLHKIGKIRYFKVFMHIKSGFKSYIFCNGYVGYTTYIIQ